MEDGNLLHGRVVGHEFPQIFALGANDELVGREFAIFANELEIHETFSLADLLHHGLDLPRLAEGDHDHHLEALVGFFLDVSRNTYTLDRKKKSIKQAGRLASRTKPFKLVL